MGASSKNCFETGSLLTVRGKQPCILLAGDAPASRRVARMLLDEMGCHVEVAASGQEAADAVHSYPYDALLINIPMPEPDGIAAAKGIRNIAGIGGDLPVIALTADTKEPGKMGSKEAA